MEDTKDKYAGGETQAKEAFDELCGMYAALEVCRVLHSSVLALVIN